MKKIRWFVDPRKEEKWLNSIEGYRLKNVNFIIYTFEESNKKYNYSLNYTAGKIEYLTLLNNMKSGVNEVKHSIGWTYLEKDSKNKTFYRKEDVHQDNLKLFVRKYDLFSRAFFLFGMASLFLVISVDILFLICSVLLFVLSMLYQLSIRTTKKEINKRK